MFFNGEDMYITLKTSGVQTRTDSFLPAQHLISYTYRWDTIVRGSSEAHPEIPKYNFDFVEFNKIRLLPKENQNLQDVYGTLEGVSQLMFRKGLMLKEIFLKNSRYQLKARIQDDTESTLITIFGDEAEELLKHPASDLARLIESADGIQTVKAIMDEIIGTSIVFEIKINQYNIQSQGKYGFTANKVFQMDYNLDSHQIQEEIEQVTESSQILNDSFQAQLPDNMQLNNSTLMKEKQILLASSNDIPQPSNKKKRPNKTFKRKAYMEFSTEDSNETSQTSLIRPLSKRVRKIKESKVLFSATIVVTTDSKCFHFFLTIAGTRNVYGKQSWLEGYDEYTEDMVGGSKLCLVIKMWKIGGVRNTQLLICHFKLWFSQTFLPKSYMYPSYPRVMQNTEQGLFV
ncbi:hypothetical protein IFM89_017441 [Coptis chinensis]|uniref:Replication factor A C-terminal domain-containing protein n=1 Tax=Coptis chinensis TaxID=261450 RepID=A0A835LHM7_9MAGN|nr:hypothetical protein IFM89_017441 [Coptis chinensis]